MQIGQKWKNEGYQNLEEIAKDYANDETTDEWKNNIQTKLTQTSLGCGIIALGQEQQQSGDGYTTVYTSNAGKTYRNYKQGSGSYKDYIFGYSKPIRTHGCCLTSMTIIVSGYKNMDINPQQAVIESRTGGNEYYPQGTLSYYGVQSTRAGWGNLLTNDQKQNIRDIVGIYLKPVVIRVTGSKKGGNSILTKSEHWVALLDYNSIEDKFYVSNPSSNTNTGWMDASTVLTSSTDYIQITN